MVERGLAWLDNFRRPAVRRERSLSIYQAFLDLARFMFGLRGVLKLLLISADFAARDDAHAARGDYPHDHLAVPAGHALPIKPTNYPCKFRFAGRGRARCVQVKRPVRSLT